MPLLQANPMSPAGALWAVSAAVLYSTASRYGNAVLVNSSVLPEEKHVSVVITQTKQANMVLPFKHT